MKEIYALKDAKVLNYKKGINKYNIMKDAIKIKVIVKFHVMETQIAYHNAIVKYVQMDVNIPILSLINLDALSHKKIVNIIMIMCVKI